MWTGLLPYLGYIAIGLGWQYLKPFQITANLLRRYLNAIIFSILVPAYLLLFLWQVKFSAHLGRQLLMFLVVVTGMFAVSWLLLHRKKWSGAVKASLILAASMPAVFALGMPVVGTTTGTWAVGMAVEFGALVVLPLMFSLGSLLAYRLADKSQPLPPPIMLHEMPAIWAALAGLVLNVFEIRMPDGFSLWLRQLTDGMLPLLLITVGTSLIWRKSWNRIAIKLLPLLLISVFMPPLMIWGMAQVFGVRGPQTLATMMILSMLPSMALGFTLCERYRLDIVAYNIMFTATTVLALLSIPLLLAAMGRGWLPLV
ncbi:MAG: AEC family transporter [Gammaproteobacteria bacterium]|nr:AEC family transporter [Gammaproteobacteria bacterium]